MVYRHLPDYRAEQRRPARRASGSSSSAAGVALLSYVLEVFGEHTLRRERDRRAARRSRSSLLAGVRAPRASRAAHPLLRLALFRIRTLRVAVVGQLRHAPRRRGACRSSCRCSTRWASATAPVQSGLLIMPQSIAAMSLKMTMPKHPHALRLPRRAPRQHRLARRDRSRSSRPSDRARRRGSIVAQAFAFGFFSSLQYTSMNTLVVRRRPRDRDEHGAARSRAPMQQMSMSFGVAAASLVTARLHPRSLPRQRRRR